MDDISLYGKLKWEWQKLLNTALAGGDCSPDRIVRQAASRSVRPIVLFSELEDVKRSWLELLDRIEVEQNADRLVTRFWTLKDLMAHVASWASEFRCQVERAAYRQGPDYTILYAYSEEGPHKWNHAEVAKRQSCSVEALKREFEDQTRSLQEIALTLPEVSLRTEMEFPPAPSRDPAMLWTSNIGQIVMMKCLHDQWHIARLKQWFHSLGYYPDDQRP